MKEKTVKILELIGIICIALGCLFLLLTPMTLVWAFLFFMGFTSILVSIPISISIENKNNTVYFAKLNQNAVIPSKRDADGCLDLYACIDEPVVILPHTNKLIPTGIASAFDSKYRIAFRERGSNTKSNSIILAGQIDSGFRGEYFISVYNGNDIPIEITNSISEVEKTEDFIRIPTSKALCQFAIEPVPQVNIKEITYDKVLSVKSERGIGQIGSSGK